MPLPAAETATPELPPGVQVPPDAGRLRAPFLYLVDRLVGAIGGEPEPDLPTFADGAAAQAVVDAARAAHAGGRWVQVARA